MIHKIEQLIREADLSLEKCLFSDRLQIYKQEKSTGVVGVVLFCKKSSSKEYLRIISENYKTNPHIFWSILEPEQRKKWDDLLLK